MQGVHLPPINPQQTSAQKSLTLSPAQIANDQNSPPFAQQFPAGSLANQAPAFFWWLTLTLLGLLVYPLAFLTLRGLKDRGYLFAKTLSLLLLAYLSWLLANWHLVAFQPSLDRTRAGLAGQRGPVANHLAAAHTLGLSASTLASPLVRRVSIYAGFPPLCADPLI